MQLGPGLQRSAAARRHREGDFILRHGLDGHIGDGRMLGRNPLQRSMEIELAVVGIDTRRRLPGIGLARKRKLRVPPRELSVEQPRVQRDLRSRIVRHVHAVVHRIRRPGRDEPHIHHRTRGPGIAFVNRIAVSIDLQRPVEVCALFHRTFAVVFYHPAPEDGLALVVRAFEFEPCVVGIDRATGEEMADLFGANHHVDPHIVAAAQRGLQTVQRSRDWRRFTRGAGCGFDFRFLAHGERRIHVRLRGGLLIRGARG